MYFFIVCLTAFYFEISAQSKDLSRITPDTAKQIITLERLTVTAPRKQSVTDYRPAIQIIDSTELMSLPGVAEDINRALSLKPYASTQLSAINNELSVRGGHSLENVYIVDGIELDDINHFSNVFHSGGTSTSIDPHSVKQITFDGGAYSASLPPRISSAITISTKTGSSDHYRQRYNLNLSGANASVNGPHPGGTFLAVLRFADMQVIKQLVPIDGSPVFGDFLGKIAFAGKNHRLSLTTLAGIDKFEEDPARDIDDPSAHYSHIITQTASGLNYTGAIGDIVLNGTIYALYRNDDSKDSLRGKLREVIPVDDILNSEPQRLFHFNRDYGPIRFHEINNDATGGITFSGKKELTDGLLLDMGCAFRGSRTVYSRWYNIEKRACSAINGCAVVQPALKHEVLVFRGRSGGYAQCGYSNGIISVTGGIRADYWHYLHEAGVSPRVTVALRMPKAGTVTLSGGILYQEPASFNLLLYRLKFPSGFIYRTVPIVDISGFSLQRCKAVSIEYTRKFGNVGNLTLGGYYKAYDREYPFRKPGRQGIRYDFAEAIEDSLAEYAIPPGDGQKRASGIECYYETPSSWKHFRAVLSHAFFTVENRYTNGRWYDDINNIRNKFEAVAQLNVNNSHSLAARITWCEGRPYTPAVPDPNSGWFGDDPDNYMARRLPPMLLISPRYTFSHRFRKATVNLFGEVMNILDLREVIMRSTSDYGYEDITVTGILPVFGIEAIF